jgi:hypothetical protein
MPIICVGYIANFWELLLLFCAEQQVQEGRAQCEIREEGVLQGRGWQGM